MNEIQELLERYVALLQAGAGSVQGYNSHSPYMMHLAAAQEMRDAIERGDLGELAAVVNGERNMLGHNQLMGPHADAATNAFYSLDNRVTKERLAGRPPAW